MSGKQVSCHFELSQEIFLSLQPERTKLNKMSNHSLLAVSPIDGRYSRQTEPLREYFSEYALIKYRVRVEIEYFI